MPSKSGQSTLKVRSSTGAVQSQPVLITAKLIPDDKKQPPDEPKKRPDAGKLMDLTVTGPLMVDQVLTVTATVKNPLHDQSVTLTLPADLERVEGDERQPVPQLTSSGEEGVRSVAWKVKARKDGTHVLKARSSTGGKE